MTKYLAGVLSVIAVGVLLVAYGLLAPRVSATYGYPDPYRMQTGYPQPVYPQAYPGSYPVQLGNPYAPVHAVPANPYATPGSWTVPEAQPVRTVTRTVAPRRVATRTVERAPRRNWKKTALVIGGSSAAGAGLGGVIGGKKGALIGAAIGGGASTLYEATRH